MGNICLYPAKCKGGFRLLLVQRNIPGYHLSKYGLVENEKTAWELAMQYNSDMGVYSKDAVLEIVGSSMVAQRHSLEVWHCVDCGKDFLLDPDIPLCEQVPDHTYGYEYLQLMHLTADDLEDAREIGEA